MAPDLLDLFAGARQANGSGCLREGRPRARGGTFCFRGPGGAAGAPFALIGYFLVRTAIALNPDYAVGLDDALARLHREPLGSSLRGLVAAGLLTSASFSLVEARYRRLYPGPPTAGRPRGFCRSRAGY